MQHIKQIAVKATSTAGHVSTPKPSPTQNGISLKWVETLLARFSAIWPEQWADRFATMGPRRDALVSEWQAGLAGLSGQDIRRGIDRARMECRWPPNIAEFRALCTNGDTRDQRALYARLSAADEEARKALPANTWEERRAIGSARMRDLRAALHSPVNKNQSTVDQSGA